MNPRAILGCERDIRYVNTDGKCSPPLEQIGVADYDQISDSLNATRPTCFYIEGDYIVLVPTLGASVEGSIDETFPIRPGELVLEEDIRIVSAVSTPSITLSAAMPSDWDTDSTFDIHSKHSGAALKCWDRSVSVCSGTGITFDSAVDGSLTGEYAVEVGDYVCLSGEAGVPAVPYEFHHILAQAAAASFAESLGDTEAATLHDKRLRTMMETSLGAMMPRVRGKRKKLKGTPFLSLQG
jgi:hypothetical protein